MYTGEQTGSFSDFISLQQQDSSSTTNNDSDTKVVMEKKRKRSQSTTPSVDSSGVGGERGGVKESTGTEFIDRVLLQHLLHCEYLLQV